MTCDPSRGVISNPPIHKGSPSRGVTSDPNRAVASDPSSRA